MNNPGLNRDGGRRVENNRLVYYHKTADQGYWEDIWREHITPDYYKPFMEGKLYTFEKMFRRHLPKTGKILEAGCGTAQLVVALNTIGYDCLGLDYAAQTLGKVQRVAGPLRLISGDLTALGISDHAFDAIISIGVVEHRQAGPDPFLNEMSRILKPDGVMLISVPYFNDLRRWRSRHGAYQDGVSGLSFYQYAFTKTEFCSIIESSGYHVEATYSYAHQNTLSQELHWLKRIPAFLNKFILRVSKYTPYVNSQLGHMLMVVGRKKRD